MTAIGDYLAPDEPDDQRAHFRVDGPKTAEWALLKLARIRRQQQENTEVADEERRRIDLFLATENGKLERDAAFFESILTNWHREVLEDEPDRKTIVLPAGHLKARKQPDTVAVDDPDRFVQWAEGTGHLQLVRVKKDPDKQAIKQQLAAVGERLVDESGEVVPGVKVQPGEVKYSVDVTGGK